MRIPLLTLATAVALATPLAAQTGFDELSASSGTPIPAGFLGFTWSNFYALDGCTYYPVSGYCSGNVSAPIVAVNWLGGPASFSRPGDPFYFDGGDFTAGWSNNLTIKVDGYLGGDLLFTSSFIVNKSTPYAFEADWDGIDKVVFTASGGYDVSEYDGGSGTEFALDNLDLNGRVDGNDGPPVLLEGPGSSLETVTPEPMTMSLMATGLVGMAGAGIVRRRKK